MPLGAKWCEKLLLVIFAVLVGCSASDKRLPTDTPPDTTGGAVQRVTLHVDVKLLPSDSVLADALDWPGGAVNGASVTIVRIGSSSSVTRSGDAAGRATFVDLLPGTYLVSTVRLLSDGERNALPTSISEIDAVGGAGALSLEEGATLEVRATASRRGTLVISELWSGEPRVGGNYYDDGDYFEIYNNSDVSVALADKFVVSGYSGTFNNPALGGCTASAAFQRDSLGIWATFIYAFPSDAAALPAGGVALVATDAIDHRQFTTLAFDLSSASFEFRGGADVDNPSVPDMHSVGPSDGGHLSGRGLTFSASHPVLALASSMDLPGLPSKQGAGNRTWIRVPAESLLDVVTWGPVSPSFETCGSPVHASIDAQQARLINDWSTDLRSIARRTITTLPDGRAILLRTKVSANDFAAAEPSPGRVP